MKRGGGHGVVHSEMYDHVTVYTLVEMKRGGNNQRMIFTPRPNRTRTKDGDCHEINSPLLSSPSHHNILLDRP